jgi:hypothetical protein
MCQEMASLHISAPFNPELLGALSSKNFSKKNLQFEAEIYVPGYAQNAGFSGQLFSPGTLVSSTNKSYNHFITEILLKVALNTINQKPNQWHINSLCLEI